MAEPHWSAYVGMASGIVALIVSIISYRRVSAIKRLDLRLEPRNIVSTAHERLASIPDLIERADRSRKANASAGGRLKSGFMKRWADEVTADKHRIDTLLCQAPNLEERFEKVPAEHLESKIVEMRRLLSALDGIQEKYQSSIDDDKAEVRQRREIMNRRFQ